jgi:hypothetical protein
MDNFSRRLSITELVNEPSDCTDQLTNSEMMKKVPVPWSSVTFITNRCAWIPVVALQSHVPKADLPLIKLLSTSYINPLDFV